MQKDKRKEQTSIKYKTPTHTHNTEFSHQVDGDCLRLNEDCRVCSEFLITAYRPGSSLRSACQWPAPGGCTCCGSLGVWSPRRGVRSEPLHPWVCFPTYKRGKRSVVPSRTCKFFTTTIKCVRIHDGTCLWALGWLCRPPEGNEPPQHVLKHTHTHTHHIISIMLKMILSI